METRHIHVPYKEHNHRYLEREDVGLPRCNVYISVIKTEMEESDYRSMILIRKYKGFRGLLIEKLTKGKSEEELKLENILEALKHITEPTDIMVYLEDILLENIISRNANHKYTVSTSTISTSYKNAYKKVEVIDLLETDVWKKIQKSIEDNKHKLYAYRNYYLKDESLELLEKVNKNMSMWGKPYEEALTFDVYKSDK